MPPFTNASSKTAGIADRPLRNLRRDSPSEQRRCNSTCSQNVGHSERLLSAAAGVALGVAGLCRKDLPGLIIAGLGGALVYRGASGRCSAYTALGINTAESSTAPKPGGVEVAVSYLINKPADQLYTFWRDFEQLPSL
jgi:uncharacterized membrane protein